MVFPPEDEGDKYIIIPFFWLPEEQMKLRVRRDHVMYDQWAGEGHIYLTEGDVVHYGAVKQKIMEICEMFDVQEIAVDRWNATMMIQELEDEGLNVVRFGQGFKDMSPPTKELMRLVLREEIRHDKNPVLRWCMDNAYVRTDPAGNQKIDKEKSTEKVDGAVATVMALSRAIANMGGSVYDDERGLLFI